MRIIKKKPTAEELLVFFKAIIDRRGMMPKTEKKLLNQKFLEEFLRYIHMNHSDIDHTAEDAAIALLKDFGKRLVLARSNLGLIEYLLPVVQYCTLSDRLSAEDWYHIVTIGNDTNKYSRWIDLMASVIVSDQITDTQMIPICNVYGLLHESNYDHGYSVPTRDVYGIHMTQLSKVVQCNCEDYNHKIRSRLALAMIHTYDSIKLQAKNLTIVDVRLCIKYAIYANANKGDYAAIVPKYYNPFTFDEYLDMVVTYRLEPDYDTVNEYLDPKRCDENYRMEVLKLLCKSNGNNIRLAKTKQEIAAGVTAMGFHSKITDYAVLKKAYPNGIQDEIRDEFIRYGDLSTIPSDDIPSMFTDDEKIRIIAFRFDAEKQYVHLLRKPNGIIYLSSAIKHLSYVDLTEFMKAYVTYMETVDDYREDGVSMDLYMASYIKETVSMDNILRSCPKMLRYIDLLITDLPSEYIGLDKWLDVARNAPVVNLSDGTLFQKIMRVNIYVPLNYHHVAFSSETFGIEEIVTDSKDLCKLMDTHPGYYFDIKDPKVKEIILEYLVEKVS